MRADFPIFEIIMEPNPRVKKPSRGSAAKSQSVFKKRRRGVKELDRLARISAGAAKNLADGKALFRIELCFIQRGINIAFNVVRIIPLFTNVDLYPHLSGPIGQT